MQSNAKTLDTEPAASADQDDGGTDMDLMHVLPLHIIPFKTRTLKSARLIKNSRLEPVVEVYRTEDGASGQFAVSDTVSALGLETDNPDTEIDLRILGQLGGLNSYDIYSLRRMLRNLGIEIDSHDSLKLSANKCAELGQYMGEFTRPLLQKVYSGAEANIEDLDQLLNLFRSPDRAEAMKNLQVMADMLQIGLADIPAFLEDYGDIFLSLAYFRERLDYLIPVITGFIDDIKELQENFQLRSDRNLMKTCTFMGERLSDITASLTGRFEHFHQHSDQMWTNVTAESFREVKTLISSHHTTLGGVLCGLTVKMSLWEERFPGGRGGLIQRSEFVMSEMRHGIDVIDKIEKPAPSLVNIRR
jgi:hypothetical protein